MKVANHSFIVWSSNFLWFISIFAITWSVLLFYCMGDMLKMTGLDLINAFVLLSGIIMLPMNIHILYYIANGKKISRNAHVVCCPLWMCILWVIVINIAAVLLCAKRISWCRLNTDIAIEDSMKYYRTLPNYKRFIDNIQWSLKCCGLKSFKDWFSHDWYDKIRDYEWDPMTNRHGRLSKEPSSPATDSVPLSCCKSGSCISNFLMELGTHSINTRGCSLNLYRVVMIVLTVLLILFLLVILDEILLLKFIMAQEKELSNRRSRPMDVMHIMTAKDDFKASSGSRQLNPNDSEEDSFRDLHPKNYEKDDTD